MKRKILCIYCAGGMGREIAEFSCILQQWSEIVFVDDNIKKRRINDTSVYTLEEVVKNHDTAKLEFVVAAGEPSTRRLLYKNLFNRNLQCVSIKASGATFSRFSSAGVGTILHIGSLVTCNTHLGFGCLINKHVIIAHDVTIGDYSVLSPNAKVGGNVKIGRECYIGSGAIIRNGISIGESSIIGMGAVVLKDVAPKSVMVGNPARLLRANIDKRVF